MTSSVDHDPRRSVFERLGRWASRRRWTALGLWVAALAAVVAAAAAAGGDHRNDFSLPGTESQAVIEALERHAPEQAGDAVQVVLRDARGIDAPGTRERIERMLDEVGRQPGVGAVASPFAAPDAISGDGRTAYATVTLSGAAGAVPAQEVRRLVDVARAAGGDGLRVEVTGTAVRDAQAGAGGLAEGAGLLAALVILVVLFGSILAASLPLITAVFAVGGTIALLALASHLIDVPDYAAALMTLVGLGVGIDYALLIFSRYRTELLAGRDRETATAVALDTAGRTVVFAGGTVVIALLGLLALGLGALKGIALGVAVTVLVTLVASLTLLPALLAIGGARIERGVRRRGARTRGDDGARWRRWAALVQRRPWPTLVVALAVLLALAAPALDMRLGFSDAGNDPPSTTTRQGYDLLAGAFGPGATAPLVVLAEGGEHAGAATRRALEAMPGVASATPPVASPDGALSTIVAFPATAPQDARTADLVERLRDDVLPGVARATGARLLVGGQTAADEDFASAVARRLPAFVAIVVGLSSLLLMVVFRSLLVPLKAAALNLLSIGAALGVITLVFQHGWLGVEPGPIEAFLPVLIFAIVFGLSMDYEVFLVSRMHEEWERTGDAQAAVREGLATTGRVITAAAAIMVVVFGAFVLSPDRMLQQFGLGLAAAILVDALIIRCLVVPAVMRLLGARAWWMPAWLGRRLPRLALERT